jgi:hypothetical protein
MERLSFVLAPPGAVVQPCRLEAERDGTPQLRLRLALGRTVRLRREALGAVGCRLASRTGRGAREEKSQRESRCVELSAHTALLAQTVSFDGR